MAPSSQRGVPSLLPFPATHGAAAAFFGMYLTMFGCAWCVRATGSGTAFPAARPTSKLGSHKPGKLFRRFSSEYSYGK